MSFLFFRYALQLLYSWDARQRTKTILSREAYDDFWAIFAELPAAELRAQVEDKIAAVIAVQPQLDEILSYTAIHWKLSRMSCVDRNILRLFAFELTYGQLPRSLVINTALEIAKDFSEANAHLFINGILDQLYPKVRAECLPAAASVALPVATTAVDCGSPS